MLQKGLYEQVITEELSAELAQCSRSSTTQRIDAAEAAGILARHVAEVVERGLDRIRDEMRDDARALQAQVALVNQIITGVRNATRDDDFAALAVAERAEQLFAVFGTKDSPLAVNSTVIRPETSLAQSGLLTGAAREPQLYAELRKEILSCDRIDMLVSFIRWSGLRLIMDALRCFTQDGGRLRVITTSYMGATDLKAIDELHKLLNTSIRISYNTKNTRLHAKAYVFHRDTGFTTAYVGSSNLSHAALTSGLEWNTKITLKDLPETVRKVAATFEIYWNDAEFEEYDEGQRSRLDTALHTEKGSGTGNVIYTLDVQPYAYQQEILDRLEAERTIRGHTRNLVVAATGTGKTVISALDYRTFRRRHPGQRCRLLFVAHREEILRQSLRTFQAVLKDANFGELCDGNSRPDSLDHLFITIQSLNSRSITSLTTPGFYDYIVVDEFHHAAAPTYQTLLDYYQPQILLGLTATPERMDGKSILGCFGNRIAAEIRLPEAIERGLLVPFQYFGVTDTVDLVGLRWSAGGYDRAELSGLYTQSGGVAERRADLIVSSVCRYVTDIREVKGLGFCVSVKHAEFMCDYFCRHGIASMCLTGRSSEEERRRAQTDLVSGMVRFIFVVDIYNEGVDIPEVNTVLFLRPTESLTVFLQQLGRGLRLAENKECLTVLDFIGQADRRYRFEEKFAALLSDTTRNVAREIREEFRSVPRGCSIRLEKKASEYILENIRQAWDRRSGLVARIGSFEEDSGLPLSLAGFLQFHHLDPRRVYRHATFSRLCVRAGVMDAYEEPLEATLQKALARFSVTDSRRWIDFLLSLLPALGQVRPEQLSELQKRMLQMFHITVWGGTAVEDWQDDTVRKRHRALAGSPVLVHELMNLLQYQKDRIDFVDEPVDGETDCPLDLHCTYTRDQLLVALGVPRPDTVREGVRWLPDRRTDVLLVTLNKSDREYSPTTMYNDYAINEWLFHWQSQSGTSEQSRTGQRYIHHREHGSRVLLFVRSFKKDQVSGTAEAYCCLGTASYVRHTGEKPMNIIWKLDRPIPAKYLKKTKTLVQS